MKRKDLVSVLMPAYNAEEHIEEAINSVLVQSYENFELLIWNDASNDNTETIVSNFKDKRIRLHRNSKNLGYLLTFNKLLSSARGELITFLDSDDIMLPHRLDKQVDFLILNQNIGLVGTNFGRITNKGKIYFRSKLPLDHNSLMNSVRLGKEFPFCGSTVMIRREVFETVGGYREYFNGFPGEDIDWIMRISEKYPVANIEYMGYLYRFSPSSLTRKPQVEIKARHIGEIIDFLADQRSKNNGIDDLIKDSGELHKVEEKLAQPYKNDLSMLDRRLGVEYAIQKKWYPSLSHSIKAIKKGCFSVRNYITILANIAILILPSSFLLQTKNFLGFNHVANKI